MKDSISLLRTISLAEGVSFLLLLGVAMPLKHLAGYPLAVKIVGWFHGILFMVLCLVLVRVMMSMRWPMTRGALVFVAALLPFGPFVIDRRLRGYELECGSR
jgi:integral membrane protein